jgi:hypothetical protein
MDGDGQHPFTEMTVDETEESGPRPLTVASAANIESKIAAG